MINLILIKDALRARINIKASTEMRNKSILKRKGIILAGGNGTRLYPITKGISKQLLPIFDKPMIQYPLSTLMLSGINEILIITKEQEQAAFKRLLGDGSNYGMTIKYAVQKHPDGLAQAFLIAENFLNNAPAALILGDNLFHGSNFTIQLEKVNKKIRTNTIFAYPVKDPNRYGVVEFNTHGKVIDIQEKPLRAKSKYAVTGLYFFDNSVVEKAKKVKPSERGELEITSINQMYLEEDNLHVELMGRGMAWLDTGTFDSLHQAGSFIRTLEKRQGLKIGCPEEIAWRKGWIDDKQFKDLGEKLSNSPYGEYLKDILKDKNNNIPNRIETY